MTSNVLPSQAELEAFCRQYRADAQSSPIFAEKLRHVYAKVLEVEYPELQAAMGKILPIDTSVDPADISWEYHMIDQAGYADWIDEEGQLAPGSAMTLTRFSGEMHEFGHMWDVNDFDLERSAKSGFQLVSMKQNAARRAHEALANWVWLFGESNKNLIGLCNHPNITTSLADTAAASPNGRTWATSSGKTNDEILEDVAVLLNTIPEQTSEMHHASIVYLPPSYMRACRDRRLGAGDGFASLWDLIVDRYKGDDSGQGKVSFRMLNECDSALRRHPKTGADDSGIPGDFILAMASMSKDEAAFIRARPFTQLPPEKTGFVTQNFSHAKIGGCKLQLPLAVHRLDFAVGS